MEAIPACHTCKWWYGDLTCAAFPERIPDEIIYTAVNDHKKPVEGDHDIQYVRGTEPIEE
jgi:hypothetical protein